MQSLFSRAAVAGLLMGVSLFAAAEGMPTSEAPAGAKVYIVSPKDGDTVDKTFTVKFGIEGMKLAPAGDATPNTGHHHLLVDVTEQPPAGVPLPVTDHILHFGKAQTETQLTLAPGKHTLQLLLGDKYHVPFKPTVESEKITVTVK
ncbi:MAG: DUF4399 domain-containing protein [Pseudomonas sp.]|uniref:DUF4399 domain-containing protein n=1 Tax=Pseudomonas abieticivorans TaxID=2931382 RepID=UPI0020C0DFCA|nr:DUF4399 domain-containing protein [Pseudomonas sp. PIA16]MDE1168369.1 DUF4399 domain-containing protein [Pseudomonas sp.]